MMDNFKTYRDDSNTPPGECAPSLIAQIRDHAERNYNNGFDFIVECYSDAEIAAECKDKKWTTLAQWIAFYSEVVDVRADRQADADQEGYDGATPEPITVVNLKEYGLTFRCEYPISPGASTWTRYTVNLMPCEWWLFPEDHPAHKDILATPQADDSTGWLFIIEIHGGETIREYFSTFAEGAERYRASVVSFADSCRYLRSVK